MRLDAPTPRLSLLGFAILLCCGCSVDQPSTRAGQTDTALDFVWQRVGTTPGGCAMYTKKPVAQHIIVDNAIWFRNAQGQYVLDEHACSPSTFQGNPQ